ncbi:tRNA-dependent cyclodipeptide synthase [Maridesulfovibrio sp.]|uniref:tRNA-dependent cyclodipeptide synthase n=1 Tax=Maridesulfovibrio sp. TaxID=2795000 RepID=UPI0039EE486B
MSFIINKLETSGNGEAMLQEGIQENVLLAICPYSFMVSKRFLRSYLPWIAAHTAKSHIFLGDYWERHNLIAQGSNRRQASDKMMKKGRSIKKTIHSVLSEFDLTEHFKFIDLFEDSKTEDYQEILKQIILYSENSKLFMTDMESLASTFMFRRLPQMYGDYDVLSHLVNYIFEEIAFYLCWNLRGWKVEVYPGPDLDILKKIFAGAYENFPVQMDKRVHISVEKI